MTAVRLFVVAALLVTLSAPGTGAVAVAPVPDDALTLRYEAADAQVHIVRDAFGVPHVHGDSLEGVSYGAGYANAQDKLFLSHILRLATKGELHQLLPLPELVETDKGVRRLTYTAAERQRQFAALPDDERRAISAYVEGMNGWIDQVNSDPAKMPLEFVEFGIVPVPAWTVDDTMACLTLLGQFGGAYGGNEIKHAALRDRLTTSFGADVGQRMFDDLVRTEDPYSPVTLDPETTDASTPTMVDESVVGPLRTLTPDARLGLSDGADASAPATGRSLPSTLAGIASGAVDWQAAERDTAWIGKVTGALRMFPLFGSNAQLVAPALSATGNSLLTAGPQTALSSPGVYTEIGLHGGGFEGIGMTLPGFGPMIALGRGRGYAWTITNGYSDLRDIFTVDVDPSNARRYRFGDGYEPMDCRAETYAHRGVPLDEDVVCRTRLGVVVGRSADGTKALVYAASTYDRDGNGFRAYFGLSRATSLSDFATSANLMPDSMNLHYADDRGNIGYWHTGHHPIRRPDVDQRLPQDGNSGGWLGVRPVQESPHALNPPQQHLVNWNNQPTRGWARERSYNTYQWRVLDLTDAFDSGVDSSASNGGRIEPGRNWTGADLSRNLRHGAAANGSFRGLRHALPAPSGLSGELSRTALALVSGWNGQQVDEDADDYYDSAGTTIANAWRSALLSEVFGQLGPDAGFPDNGELIWVMTPEQTPRPAHDWLKGRTAAEVSADAFDKAVSSLASRFGNDDPSTWRSPVRRTAYARYNADLLTDAGHRALCLALADQELADPCPGPLDEGAGSSLPGDVADPPYMNRGAYNAVVSFMDPARGKSAPMGSSRVHACSILPPGQSGFVNLAGRESPHYRDQFDLYNAWLYKQMPLTTTEIATAAEAKHPCRP